MTSIRVVEWNEDDGFDGDLTDRVLVAVLDGGHGSVHRHSLGAYIGIYDAEGQVEYGFACWWEAIDSDSQIILRGQSATLEAAKADALDALEALDLEALEAETEDDEP